MAKGSLATRGPVLIVGTGLIGTSIALALRGSGISVYLDDISPVSLAIASDMGAGTPLSDLPADAPAPRLVIVGVPPDVADKTILELLLEFPDATVTDVASVKVAVEQSLVQAVQDLVVDGSLTDSAVIDLLSRYVGSHPMAGRERSGAVNAHADLFYGRPWVVVPSQWSSSAAVLRVREMVVDLGAVPLELPADEHDRAVAMVSHVPQLVASLIAGRLTEASPQSLMLAGKGLTDTTRIAAADPMLWTAIIAGNSSSVLDILCELRQDLDSLIGGLQNGTTNPLAPGVASAVSRVIAAGNKGVQRIPGKHGTQPRRWATIEVLVPDKPGELGRLFSELGIEGINIEDLQLEHSAGQPVGLARIQVDPRVADAAAAALEGRGWRIAGSREQ